MTGARSLRWRSGLRYLLVILPFVGLPLVCCSSMGTLAIVEATRDAGEVEPGALMDVPEASRLEAHLGLVPVRQQDPYRAGEPTGLYWVAGAERVVVYCQDCAYDPGAAAIPVRGRICDAGVSVSLACHLEPEVSLALDDYARAQGRDRADYRVILSGATTTSDWLGATCTFGAVGLLLLLVAGGFVVVIRDGRAGPARLAREQTWQLPVSDAELLARVGSMRGARVVEQSALHIVVLLGRTEAQARLWGVRRAEQVPLRLTVRVAHDGPYQGVRVDARVEEDWVWHRKLAEPLVKLVDRALDARLAELAAAVGAR